MTISRVTGRELVDFLQSRIDICRAKHQPFGSRAFDGNKLIDVEGWYPPFTIAYTKDLEFIDQVSHNIATFRGAYAWESVIELKQSRLIKFYAAPKHNLEKPSNSADVLRLETCGVDPEYLQEVSKMFEDMPRLVDHLQL